MNDPADYFFCGIGGSGMAPLAAIVQGLGARVEGSDRARDQGRNAPKFDALARRGIVLHPQDGSGLTRTGQVLVTSAAVEETIPDVRAARGLGARMLTRAELLSSLFNAAARSIGIAGTSGKSTVTGMLAWILHEAGARPTVMNGAEMRNFVRPDEPFASALVGDGDPFVSEIDESDGSIALYRPGVAVVTNVSLDHKPMAELTGLFRDFAGRAGHAVLNADDRESAPLLAGRDPAATTTFGLGPEADLRAVDIRDEPSAIGFVLRSDGGERPVRLGVPGRHNVRNALAALAAARAFGIDPVLAAESLAGFRGIRRRFEVMGEAGGVTVIDDFAHNPDKIAATLATLHAFPGRVLCLFQPHGYGPLRLMGPALAEAFGQGLAAGDVLLMPEPVYFGGTADRSVGSASVAAAVAALGRDAAAYPTRDECADRLVALARPGDRIVVMGARDDTLPLFAADLLDRIRARLD